MIIVSIVRYFHVLLFIFCLMAASSHGLSPHEPSSTHLHSRRTALAQAVTAGITLLVGGTNAAFVEHASAAAAAAPGLTFEKSSSGIEWADAKVGTGTPLQPGATATIDYVLSTTGARYGTKIYSSKDLDIPYRWTLGDGSTIEGIELAILGDGGIGTSSLTAMRPGGIRRVVIPQALGYSKLAGANSRTLCVENGTPGPIPPPTKAFEEYQRFKNIYCNPNLPYQPDIVLDVKLYGQR